jgi:hypothetical protein
MKTAVVGEWRQDRLQPGAHRFCSALRLPAQGLPALSAKPRERWSDPIREDFFLGRCFRNLDDLNAQLRHWLDTVANPRLHATTQRVVNEAFAKGKPHLKMLPLAPRIVAGPKRSHCGSNTVERKRCKASLTDFSLRGKALDVRSCGSLTPHLFNVVGFAVGCGLLDY